MSVIPPFFITEPKSLVDESEPQTSEKMSFLRGLMNIQPLWGFLIYSVYGMAIRLLHIEVNHYWVEWSCLALSIFFIAKTLMTKESINADGTSEVGFRKVLAAHSFTWLGIQSMFVYIVVFIQYNMSQLDAIAVGKVISGSFLVLSIVSAILPVLVLEPLAKRFGRIKVHSVSILSMSLGYFALSQLGSSAYTIYLMMAVLGIGWAATISLPFAIMSQKVNAAKMGLYMGLFNLSVVLPQLVSSVGIGKILSEVADKNILFIICGVSLLISALAWFTVTEDTSETNDISAPTSGH